METEEDRLGHHCSLLGMHGEILGNTDNFRYNTGEKTDTQNKVGSGQGCRARFGPRLPRG